MANLHESQNYEAGIYQLETTDPVVAGPGGISNVQAKQLANRTAWLKQQVDTLLSDFGGLGLNDVSGLQAALNQKLPSSNYTAADVLAKLLTVDGNGSGVDADKVRGLDADFSSYFGNFGYQKIPGGFIIQWARSSSKVRHLGNYNFAFPIAFPNACLAAVANEYGRLSEDVQLQINSLSKTNVTIYIDGTTLSSHSGGAMFMAVGY